MTREPRSISRQATGAVAPARSADVKIRGVASGGWFLAEDLNGDVLVVQLPARSEPGS